MTANPKPSTSSSRSAAGKDTVSGVTTSTVVATPSTIALPTKIRHSNGTACNAGYAAAAPLTLPAEQELDPTEVLTKHPVIAPE